MKSGLSIKNGETISQILIANKIMEDFSKYNGEGTILRKAQLRMLDILIEIDKICRKHNIEYWLEAGTLLGAVRHGGFIPWDDDIDITISRKDYKRLKAVLQDELNENFIFVDSSVDSNFFDNCARVKDRRTYIDNRLYKYQKEQGLFVDIFTVEEMPSLIVKNIIDRTYGRIYRQLHGFGKVVYTSKLKINIVYALSLLLAPIVYALVWLYSFICRSIGGNKMGLAYGLTFPQTKYKTDIFPCLNIEFEGYYFMCPNNVHNYLTNHFGDYMTLPPEDKRPVHHNLHAKSTII